MREAGEKRLKPGPTSEVLPTGDIRSARRRIEPGRSCSTTDGADDRNVLELPAGRGGAQQQTSTAHIAPADEIGREDEPHSENRREHLHVFFRRHAAEQHEL